MSSINLEQLKEYMRQQVEIDRQNKNVHVTGETLEEALRQAAIELGTPVKKLEYEVLQKGSKGVLGIRKKEWSLLVYEAIAAKPVGDVLEDSFADLQIDVPLDAQEIDVDGSVYLRLSYEGAFLIADPPKGKGKMPREKVAYDLLKERAIRDIDKEMVKKVVTLASSDWVKVGSFIHNPAADAIMTVELIEMDMKAFIRVSPPGPGGADLSKEDIYGMLSNNGVVHGVIRSAVDDFEKKPVYNDLYLAAEGEKPQKGKDAKIIYNFQTDPTLIKPKEVDGKVDFKNLNLVQNVVKGQVLAKKILSQKGIPGRTVTGKILPAKDGMDVEFSLGNNVVLSLDGKTVSAETNGQVLLLGSKITVETVRIIPGDVGIATGNIKSLGTVIVKGSVEDGYSIEAAGNIEVHGNVGKASLKTEGDIIVHQGVNGGSEGNLHSGQTVWSKFIQNAKVDAGHFVVVSDGILHSQVDANKKILCKGKRAKIVGGHLRAAEEINASVLGAIGSAETILEVGYDPKSKEELEALQQNQEKLELEIDELDLNLQGLMKQKRARKKLDPTKEKFLRKLVQDKDQKSRELEVLVENIRKRIEYLSSLQYLGKVSASNKVYPGVKIRIKDAEYEVTTEFNSVTFINEGGLVKTAPYEEIEDDISRRT